ncbi:MAG TPA: molybdenum cofactor biosynthesis protein MoaE [Gemmatimonadales bacterium]|jgi:molybdopterin synthase catalytic subunit
MISYLTAQAIDVTALAARITAPERGAVVTFSGLVRNHHAGREVVGLEYSAYDTMAEHVCAAIVGSAESRWKCRVAVQHRLGRLAVGDVAVAVAVGAGHRDAAFEAARWVIDEIKRHVPIWKREEYTDGTSGWVDPTAPQGMIAASS